MLRCFACCVSESAYARKGIHLSPRPFKSIMPDERKKTHAPKVCSVLLPLYAASDYQSLDQFKGYDKVTKSPDHLTLPKWNIPHDKVQKYRAGATTNPAHA